GCGHRRVSTSVLGTGLSSASTVGGTTDDLRGAVAICGQSHRDVEGIVANTCSSGDGDTPSGGPASSGREGRGAGALRGPQPGRRRPWRAALRGRGERSAVLLTPITVGEPHLAVARTARVRSS